MFIILSLFIINLLFAINIYSQELSGLSAFYREAIIKSSNESSDYFRGRANDLYGFTRVDTRFRIHSSRSTPSDLTSVH